MIERMITITNRAGIHARPAAVLVQAAQTFNSNIYFEKGRERINAKSIMGIIAMAAAFGTEIKIITEGEDEEQAMEAIVRLFQTKFEED